MQLVPNSSMTVGFQSPGLGVVPPPTAEPKIGNRNIGTLEPWNPETLEPWNPGTLESWNPQNVNARTLKR